METDFQNIYTKISFLSKIGHFDRIEELLKSCQNDIDGQDSLSEIQNLIGINYSRQSEFDNAVVSFKNALTQKPQNFESRLNLAVTFCDIGFYGEAENLLNLGSVMNSSIENSLFSIKKLENHYHDLVQYLDSLNKFDEALSVFQSAISGNPNNQFLRILFGKFLIKNGERKQAKKTLLELVESNANVCAEVYVLLGVISYAEGCSDAAKGYWSCAHKIENSNEISSCCQAVFPE